VHSGAAVADSNSRSSIDPCYTFIEERYHEPISLKDVARAVSLSLGHLTTVVKRKTGRAVQEWIAERRMAQARRLLIETDLSVE
jgi:AraC family transcriptional activator of pobA